VLSSTDTIAKVKEKLINDYLYFSFASDALFVTALTSISDDIVRTYFYPRIGQTEYNRIKAKNHVGLLEKEEALFWAEVYTICYEFLKWRVAKSGQLQTAGGSESLKVEGYTYSTGVSEGISENDKSLKFYYGQMFRYWMIAGFNLNALERTCTIFGDGYLYDSNRSIIE
jgi:hypothetical protein